MKRNLANIKQAAKVNHVIIEGLTHSSSYNAEEVLEVAKFLAQRFGLKFEARDALPRLRGFFAKQDAAMKSWEDLSESEQRLAARLGISTATAWDEGTAKVWELSWDQLSFLQRQAAQALGFTEANWGKDTQDSEKDPGCDKDWVNLTADEKALAAKLGVKSKNAWDNGTAPVWNKAWRKLSHAELKAAQQLGFNESSWNGT